MCIFGSLAAVIAMMTFLANGQYNQRDEFGESGFSGVIGTITENRNRRPTVIEILYAETEYFISIITSQGFYYSRLHLSHGI